MKSAIPPKYLEISNFIISKILNNEFKPGEQIFTEPELQQMFNVSRGTARAAINYVANKNYIETFHGRGSYVKEQMETPQIGFVVPHLYVFGQNTEMKYDSMFMMHYVSHLSVLANENNVRLNLSVGTDQLIFDNDFIINKEKENITNLIKQGINGIILFSIAPDINIDVLYMLRDSNIPFVMVDRYASDFTSNYVVSDNYNGFYNLTKEVINSGADEIFYFGDNSDINSSKDRFDGFIDCMSDNRLDAEKRSMVIKSDFVFSHTEELIYQDAIELLKNYKGKKVAICANDNIVANAILKAAVDVDFNLDDLILAHFDEPILNIVNVKRIIAVQSIQEICKIALNTVVYKKNKLVQRKLLPTIVTKRC